ncbi:MAG: ThuA domain-containing protein [Microthrixaceae bacterium]
MTRSALILSGGNHPFDQTTPRVQTLAEEAGFEVTVVDSPPDAARHLESKDPDLWVCNTLRWRMLADQYANLREEFAYEIDANTSARIEAWVNGGGRLLALHAAPICFDNWQGWGELIDARWQWGVSSHPPLAEITVEFTAEHPLTSGLADFCMLDEAYGDMWLAPEVEPLAISRWGGREHPMLWVRSVGDGTVVTSTLGHGAESFDHPTHREVLRRSMSLLSRPEVPV